MTTMTSLGIGSGLDLQTMLTQLQAAEQTRLSPYTSLQKSYESKISTWGKISSGLSSLKKSVESLQKDAFNTLSISSNNAFSATATSEASADSHEITVMQLATAHKIKTATKPSADDDLGSSSDERTIKITQGNGKEIEVTLKQDETSLNDIAKAINKQGGDVKATVQRTDEGYQLMLSSKTTGSDGAISVDVEGDEDLAGILNCHNGGSPVDENGNPTNGDAMLVVTEAQDAKLRVDGSNYTRSSNDISDIITGVTLNLKTVSEKEGDSYQSEQLTLTKDSSAIKKSLQDFVKQYNALLSTTNDAAKYVPNDTSGLTDEDIAKPNNSNGALVGDSMLRGMVGDIRSTVNGVFGESGADYASLADIGITIDATTGQMTLNDSKLDEAIADNPDQIANIFQDHNGQKGMANTLNDIIVSFIGDEDSKIDGQIKSTTDSLDDQVKIVKGQIDKMQKLVDAQVERYRVQFQNLDATMSKMSSMSNALTSLMTSLS